jgi:hypothetical protein
MLHTLSDPFSNSSRIPYFHEVPSSTCILISNVDSKGSGVKYGGINLVEEPLVIGNGYPSF